ncbi:MAG: alpha/beta hydrolase [Pseudobdellovibrionaceae bacterium]
MLQRSEGFFQSLKPGRLFFQNWKVQNPVGTVIITHGHGEHSECYHRLVDFFKNDSWNFIAWDIRGHGKSEGPRGYAEHFQDYLDDFKTFINNCLQLEDVKNKPVILLSHSMGGMIQLRALAEDLDLQKKITAQVCSAPFLEVAMPVPEWKKFLAKKVSNFLPHLTMDSGMKNEYLTHDPEVIRECEQDPLRHQKVSPRVYLGFLECFEKIPGLAVNITLPTLFQLPEKDPVVSTPRGREVFKKLGSSNKEIYIYADACHEIYNDTLRKNAYADLKKFLDQWK